MPPLVHEESVGFFLARARAVRPDFQVDDAVSEICRRLDDLPLALELAAARVKALSTAQILERLDERLPLLTGGARDLPERQRTLRAAIEWSYDLLSEDEQRLFARLAVFRGGCTLEAGERVAGTDLDALQSLVDKSLVRHTDERIWMLETIREYASGRLEESGAAEKLRRRHAEYFLEFAEAAEPQLRRDSEEWVNRLEAEHDNLRSALDWLGVSGDSERSMRLAGAVSRFWYLHSHLSEGRRRLDTVLASDARPTPARAKALNGAAIIALSIGDAEAAPRAEEALELHRELGDPWGLAYSKMMIGNALAETGDLVGARSVLEESLQAFVELGDEHYAGLASVNLAWVTGDLGDKERGRELDDENLARARVLGNRRLEAYSIAQLATFARDEGRLWEASTMLKESLRILRELGDRLELAVDLGRLASVLALAGSAEPAARLLSSAEALRRSWVQACRGGLGRGTRRRLRSSARSLTKPPLTRRGSRVGGLRPTRRSHLRSTRSSVRSDLPFGTVTLPLHGRRGRTRRATPSSPAREWIRSVKRHFVSTRAASDPAASESRRFLILKIDVCRLRVLKRRDARPCECVCVPRRSR